MAKRKEFDISDPPTNMFDMKEWERFMVKEKKKVITVDDRYKAKLSAVLMCKECNAKNTINVLHKEKKEEMRAGDYICYYYKPVVVPSSPHSVVRACWRQESVL